LEIYFKKFPNFIYGSPTSTKTLGQDEEIEARPSGTIQEEEVQTKELDFRSGVIQEEEIQTNKP